MRVSDIKSSGKHKPERTDLMTLSIGKATDPLSFRNTPRSASASRVQWIVTPHRLQNVKYLGQLIGGWVVGWIGGWVVGWLGGCPSL